MNSFCANLNILSLLKPGCVTMHSIGNVSSNLLNITSFNAQYFYCNENLTYFFNIYK